MARRPRQDHPGAWHHVIQRGLARRPLFEDRTDIRFFLSRLAREVRRGRLEVHAWCVLTTHFHLLVKSPRGELSEALRRAQNEYSRFFNRRHERDGALVRGRFLSKPVQSLTYRRVLVAYIDGNAVQARLASSPWRYPYGSAARYVLGTGPAWLERSWIEGEVRSALGRSSFRPQDYISVFGRSCGAGIQGLVELRMRTKRTGADGLDDLIGGAPPQVRAWLKRKAKLADGVPIGLAVCDADSVREVLVRFNTRHGAWKCSPNGRLRDAWELAEVALLRTLAVLTWEEIARAVRGTLSGCQRRFGLHRSLMEEDTAYAERLGSLASAAVRRCCSSRSGAGESG